MNVLVLGASGFIGRRVADALQASGWAAPLRASRHPASGPSSSKTVSVDTRGLAG